MLGDFSEKKELEIPLPQNFENNLFHSIGAQGVKKEVTLSHDYFFTSMIAQSFMKCHMKKRRTHFIITRENSTYSNGVDLTADTRCPKSKFKTFYLN